MTLSSRPSGEPPRETPIRHVDEYDDLTAPPLAATRSATISRATASAVSITMASAESSNSENVDVAAVPATCDSGGSGCTGPASMSAAANRTLTIRVNRICAPLVR